MFRVNSKLAGRARAVVIDNRDPLKRGRIRVKNPLIGETVWIEYLKNPGQYDVPKIGDVVYVEADCGEDTHIIASGCIVKGKDSDLDVPDVFQRIKPTNRGLYTPDGHLMEFDDGQGLLKTGKGVRLTTSGGIKIHALEGSPTESKVLIEFPSGLKLELDGTTEAVLTELTNGSKLSLTKLSGLEVVVSSNNKITIPNTGDIQVANSAATLDLKASGDIEATSGTATLKVTSSGKVSLGGSTAEVVDILSQTLEKLSTTTAPGFGAVISTVADFAVLKAKIDSIKE